MSRPTPEPKPRGAMAWMAGHSVAANLVMLLCIVGGFFALRHIKQEVFPDIQLDQVRVTVPYPGASPEEVERGILLAIEEEVRGLDGVDEVSSQAREGAGTVTIDLLLGADLQKLGQDVQSEVDRIRTLPEDAEKPQVTVVSRRRHTVSLVLFGDATEAVLRELAESMRDRMLQDEGITQIEVSGVRPPEIAIEVSRENLRRYKLTLDEIAARLRNASVELPGGGIKTKGGEILVRLKERRDYGRQFAQTPIITAPDGTEVLLGDMATVRDGFEDVDRYATYNGKRAVMLNVYRVGDQTPIGVSDAVRSRLDEVRQMLPAGLRVKILWDRATVYRQRVELLLRNGAIGLCLVLVLLGLFLEVRLAFWVMMGIPISFMGSFLLLPVTGVTVNMVSLFGYIIALGIVVDDAIVVGENVYHYHQDGVPFLPAAIRGAREVATPVTFSILTNVAAFLPLYFVPGTMGRIFRMIPVVVILVFLISLFESLFVLPAHLGHQRDRQRRGLSGWLHARQQGFSHAYKRWVRNVYGPFLRFALANRHIVIGLAFGALAVTLGYAMSGRMGFGLFPKVESDRGEASAVLPYGSPVEKTDAVMRRLVAGARKVAAGSGHEELVTGIFAEVGREGGHTVLVRAYLADPGVREKIMSTDQFCRRWREAVGPLPGLESLKYASDAGGPGHGAALTIELSHRLIDVLEKASRELAAGLQTYPRVSDVDDGFQPGKQQLDFRVKPEGKSLGLTARGVARQVRSAFYGAEALRQQRGRDEMKVMVRLPEEERVSEFDLDELILRAPNGVEAPLREVAEAQRGRAYTTIVRRNGRRVVQVSADVTPRSKGLEVEAALRAKELPELLERYPSLTCSFEGRHAEMAKSMRSLKSGFAMAMLVVFGLLAIPFRSYVQPLVVMLSIPFGIVGAILGHLAMGFSLSIMSMFGIVALAGVVVNDALVLLDFTNRQRKSGLSAEDAIYSGAIQRFRPIMLTSLTTFGGLAPMIFETSRQARFMIPMAISLGFGLLFATAITLVLVPSLYLTLEDFRGVARAARRTYRRAHDALYPPEAETQP